MVSLSSRTGNLALRKGDLIFQQGAFIQNHALYYEVIPYDVNDVLIKIICKDDYIDDIFYCPFMDGELSKMLYKLSDDHKEIIFNNIVRRVSTTVLADVRKQSNRNIRKVRAAALNKIQANLLPILKKQSDKDLPPTLVEREF